MQDYQRG